ncbi:MAG: YifB family Mg chelatase-like AAA ATPase [Eubacteriales bacterium]|nr:YifB family Mg chelatase-like AAA ATPase [Eubacteriales bacterium]
MFASIQSAALTGVTGSLIHVEADVSPGLPSMTMVGYLTSQVKEAQERVRSALRNTGIRLEPRRITLNLSPADLRKEGTAFDLPIALALLTAYGLLPPEAGQGILALGELSLNGELKPVSGVLPVAVLAAKRGLRACMVPEENRKEGEMAGEIPVIGVESLSQAIAYLKGEWKPADMQENLCGLTQYRSAACPDFANLHGQESVKRAAEVAVSGFHNFLMIGPPGSGKSAIARCIPGILPRMTMEESLEISAVYSVAGLLSAKRPLIGDRPFRAPHHTISPQALAGGGRVPKPGEVSLAHRGVLFLDELPEFGRSVLEILRQPMEDRKIQISRTEGKMEFPADFMLVAAMNACRCGYYPDLGRCTCTIGDIRRYLGKISQPLLDRIEICVETSMVRYEDLENADREESTAEIRKRVEQVRLIQSERYQESPYRFNSDLDVEGIRRYCELGSAEKEMMEAVYRRMRLSARAYHRILKVARTIADMEGEKRILCRHLSEAVCYRSVDRKYWSQEVL